MIIEIIQVYCCYYNGGELQILDVRATKLQQALETDLYFFMKPSLCSIV